jgi:hypothetical protein
MRMMKVAEANTLTWRRLLAWAALVVLALCVQVGATSPPGTLGPIGGSAVRASDDGGNGQETAVTEKVILKAAPATKVSRERLLRLAGAARGFEPASTPPEIPFRPTMDASAYQAGKEALARDAAAFAATGGGRGLVDLSVVSPFTQGFARKSAAPTAVNGVFSGVGQAEACGGCRPPDTHGAVGQSQFVEVTNQNINVFSKSGPAFAEQLSVRFADFFNYKTEAIFDPRVVYDRTWNRWVIYAEAFPEGDGPQYIFIAVSTGPDARGPYYKYGVNSRAYAADDFWDFGQLGIDQDSVIITANIFGANDDAYRTTRMFAVAKARLYNGLGWGVPLWSGLVGTLAPPNVLDQNGKTFLVAAPPSGSVIYKYTLRDSSHPGDQSLTVATIPVPAYSFPPNASQPGTANQLDTLDARFQTASTQVGDRLFQVHTVALGAYPTPFFYEFNTTTNAVVQSGFFYASPTSHDFNPSIAANDARDVFVTWSATDPGTRVSAGTNAQVRFSGRRSTDPAGVIGAGAAIFTSGTSYSLFRWGDYSAVTIDPANPLQAWVVNEHIASSTTWGTTIGWVGF